MRVPRNGSGSEAAAAKPVRRIFVHVDQATGFGRQVLRGVGKWLQEHGGFSVVAGGPGDGWPTAARLAGDAIDGIILDGWRPPAKSVRRRVPTVVVGHVPGKAPGIAIDDVAIGALAADHLVEQGFERLACCIDGTAESRRRQEGFRSRARLRGRAVEVCEAASPARLVSWLRSLPRPVGLLAADDRLAVAVIDACREAGLGVPDDVAVVGVGDDDVLCDLAKPRLTSVALDGVRVGFLAAEAVVALLAGGRAARPRRIVVPPLGVEIRGSTDTLAVADTELRSALAIIRERACTGLTIDDLADATVLTRRTLERRFQKELGRSIHDEILRVRIAAASRSLAETDTKLAVVAAETGFADTASLCHAFKRVTGQRPGDFRKSRRG